MLILQAATNVQEVGGIGGLLAFLTVVWREIAVFLSRRRIKRDAEEAWRENGKRGVANPGKAHVSGSSLDIMLTMIRENNNRIHSMEMGFVELRTLCATRHKK